MKILVYGAGVLGCQESVPRRKGCRPAGPGKLGRGTADKRTADQGYVFSPHVGEPDPSGDRAEAGGPIRCDFRRRAVYADRIRDGHAAGKSGENHHLCGQ